MSKLLLDEQPLIVLPSLAKIIGLNESIFIQQLHYWLKNSGKEHDGKLWIYNTVDQWVEQFPFWSQKTMRRIIASCEKDGLVICGNYNKRKSDKTKWYTINYKCPELSPIAHSGSGSGQSDQSQKGVVNLTSQSGQSDQMDVVNLTRALPENTTENTTDTTSASGEAPSSQGSDDSNEKPSSPTNGSGATGEGGRADSQKCDYQKREPTERGYDPNLQLTWDIHEMCGKTIRNDAMLALELSRWLLYRVRKVSPRKLTSKAERASFIKMFKRGVTPYDIKEAVIWLTTVNLQSEHQFVVQSASALAKPDKWDRIQSAMERTKPKPQDGPKTLTPEDIDRQLQRTGS